MSRKPTPSHHVSGRNVVATTSQTEYDFPSDEILTVFFRIRKVKFQEHKEVSPSVLRIKGFRNPRYSEYESRAGGKISTRIGRPKYTNAQAKSKKEKPFNVIASGRTLPK